MAEVFHAENGVGVAGPSLSGIYYPSIDHPSINGLGLVTPWGGGSIQMQMMSPVSGLSSAPSTDMDRMLSILSSVIPTGDIINYNFEGLVGPSGPAGPPGPMGVGVRGVGGTPGVAGAGSSAITADFPITDGIIFSDGTTDANTKLLLHMGGADSATVTEDSSAIGHTPTFVGTAQLDTAQSKFGTTSLLLDGNSDYLTIPHHSDFDLGTNDFTFDTWIRLGSGIDTSIDDVRRLLSHGYAGTDNGAWSFAVGHHSAWGTGKRINFVTNISGSVYNYSSDAFTMDVGVWYHVAVVQDSNTLRFFLDGVAKGTLAFSDNLVLTAIVYVGQVGNGTEYFDGWIDELRLVNGTAKWTTDFTPPTVPYSGDKDMTWTAGTLRYQGTNYSIIAGSSIDDYAYWDMGDSNTTYITTDILATVIGTDKWVMCYNDGGTIYPAHQNKVIHGGIIQADTITANNISVDNLAAINADLGTVTAGDITALSIDADRITAGTLVADRVVTATFTGVTTESTSWDTMRTITEQAYTGPDPTMTWQDYDMDYFYVSDASADSSQYVLEIKKSSLSYNGRIRCYLKNSAGTKIWEGTITDITSTSYYLFRSTEAPLSSFSDDDKVIPGFALESSSSVTVYGKGDFLYKGVATGTLSK